MGGHYRQGIAELERAARNPRYAEDAWRMIDYEAYDRNDFKRSLGALRQLARQDPKNPDHYFRMARCYAYLGDDRSAFKALRAAHKNGFTEMSLLRAEPAFERLRRRHGDLGMALVKASP